MPDFTAALTVTLVLSLLAGVVVVLTRLRLRHADPGLPLQLHTVLGVLGLVLWLAFLLSGSDADWRSLVGVLGLGCWWVVAISGLLLLERWTSGRKRGKRAAPVTTAADGWTATPWLSLLAHAGLFVAVAWFTFAYVTSKI